MHLPRFELKQPATRAEGAELLRRHGSSAKLAAGGTDLFPRMKYRLTTPEVLVSLKRVPVDDPAVNAEGSLLVDALMKLADIVRSREVRRHAPLLSDAAHWVGSSQIRHMATLGGNLCLDTRCLYYNQSHEFQFVEPCFKRGGELCYLLPTGKKCWAIAMADTSPALVCLGAQVAISDGETARVQPVEELFTGDSARPLRVGPTDIVTHITIPRGESIQGYAFMKFCPRGGLEFATVDVAILLNMLEDRETCSTARIAVGAVAASPVRARKAEDLVAGEKLSRDLFSEAAEAAAAEIRPALRPGYSRSYLKKCIETLCRDGLDAAHQRIRDNGGAHPI